MLAAIVAASSMLFVSCGDSDPSDSPSIKVSFNGNSSSTAKITVDGETDEVTVEVRVDAPGKIKEITINNVGKGPIAGYDKKSSGFTSEVLDIHEWTVVREKDEEHKITFEVVVTDKDKEAQTVRQLIEITFQEYEEPVTSTPLTHDGADFMWFREGSGNAQGFGNSGLTAGGFGTGPNFAWTVSGDNLYEFTVAEYNAVTSKEELAELFVGKTKKANHVFPLAVATPNIVLGSVNGSEYFLFHVTNTANSTVTAGTRMEVKGKYKN